MNNPLEKINRHSGMTLPDDYFDSFAERMAAALPESDFERSASTTVAKQPASLWSRVRTYVYMAAMFAGIWLMMNMFTLFSPANSSAIDSGSQLLAQLASHTSYVDDYAVDQINDLDLYDDLYESGFDPSSLSLD